MRLNVNHKKNLTNSVKICRFKLSRKSGKCKVMPDLTWLNKKENFQFKRPKSKMKKSHKVKSQMKF